MSRNESSADDAADSSSIGWKLDHAIRHLPRWLRGDRGQDWERVLQKHNWIRKDTGASITATAATGFAFSGGRLTSLLMDEFAKFPQPEDEEVLGSTEPVCDQRIFCSTYAGASGAFYTLMHEASNLVSVTLDWKDNPTRNADLFVVDEQKRKLRDVKTGETILPDYTKIFFNDHYPILKNRGFSTEDKEKIWSPWFVDRCCRPRMTPRKVAQEYERDPTGSGTIFFPVHRIEELINHTRSPSIICDVLYDDQDLTVDELVRKSVGPLRLWLTLVGDKYPAPANYVIGADISQGAGGSMSSNSVLSVFNRDTLTKVAEYASPIIKQTQFAEIAISLCRWFKNSKGAPAYLVWEANNAQTFRERVLESSFRNFYWSKPRASSRRKPTKQPGWTSTKNSKYELLDLYRAALTDGHFDNPHEIALKETLCYRYTIGDKIEFVSAVSNDEDPANAGYLHADRVIADALANMGAIELNGGMNKTVKEAKKTDSLLNPPAGSFLYRRKVAREKAEAGEVW